MSRRHTDDSGVAILVPSWDGYSDLWRPFFDFFFRNWPDCPYRVYLGTEKLRFDDERVTTVAIGSISDYSTNLLTMLASIEEDWLIVWVEDLFLRKRVDTERVRGIVACAREKRIASIRLSGGKYALSSLAARMSGREVCLGIGEIEPGYRYRAGLTVGLWRKECLAELVMPGESAWEFERQGTERSFLLRETFAASLHSESLPAPIVVENSVRGGQWTAAGVKMLREGGFAELPEDRRREPAFRTIRANAVYERLRFWLFRVRYALTRWARRRKRQ